MTGRWRLWAALFLTLAGSAWVAMQDSEDAVAIVRQPSPPESSPVRSVTVSARWPAPPALRASEAWPFDAERAHAWAGAVPAVPEAPPPATPRPAPVSVEPAPAPQAPAFPYVLIGRIEEGEVVHALLTGPTQTLGVKVQDVIDGQWRVDAIDARGLAITWLPGGLRQTLALRSSS